MKDRKRKVGAVKFANTKRKKEGADKQVLSAEERERRKQSLYRIPTSEELTELRENENLYKNNLFRMQIQYLLEEVCLNDTKEKRINDVLHSLNTFLSTLSSQEGCERDISDPTCLPKDTALPLPAFISKEKVKCKFHFHSPNEVKIIGSFLLKTLIKTNTVIDIAVEIPAQCLQPRDVLNFRYHFKRATYLSWIAFFLKKWEHTESVNFKYEVNPYMPTILLKLKGKVGKKYSLNILTKLPDECFKLSQLSPLRNNVRYSWFHDTGISDDDSKSDEMAYPTPHYNSSIISDMLHEVHLKEIYGALNECPGMKDAICLFKLWITQRSFKSVVLFNSFIGTMLMVYLLSERKISSHMSSYQIFRILLHFVASTDWSVKGITLCKDVDADEKSIENFHSVFDVVFIDSSGSLNICASIDKTTYQWIRHQAKLSMDILDNSGTNGFHGLFMKSYDFIQSVDQLFKLNKLDRFRKHLAEKEKNSMVDHGGNWCALLPKFINPVLEKGFDTRVHRMMMKPTKPTSWEISSPPPDNSNTVFWYGLVLNTEFSSNLLVMGPPADKPEAKEFSSFWGEKSELRRFQDGSINEAVVWHCTTGEEKTLISERIVKHLLKRHCHISESSVTYFGGEFNFLINQMISSTSVLGAEENLHFLKNFHELTKAVQSLKDIPLTIKSIDGIDSSFRFSDPLIPLQHSSSKDSNLGSNGSTQLPRLKKKNPLLRVHNAIVQFESCGKWPDEINAVQQIRSAFHNQLAQCIQSQLKLVAVPTPAYVDVLKNGFVFRLHVVHYREMVLYRESQALGALKKEHEARADMLDIMIVKKPVHTSLIHGLNSRFPGYAPTVTLAKRWIASQMLSGYLSEEAIELIVASIFVSPVGVDSPSTHMCGFLRFLHLLAKFDWKNEPLIVNLNGEINSDEISSIWENFTTNRCKHPSIFISTPYSKDTSLWTRSNPSPQILLRLTLLAEAALNLCSLESSHIVSKDAAKQMFRPSVNDFNVIIELDKSFVPLHQMSIDSSNTNPWQISTSKDNLNSTSLPVTEFNPPEIYLKELRDAFSDIALFFYNVYGGLKIGVVWKRGAMAEQSFKILNAQYKTVDKESSKTSSLLVVPNVKAIISDFHTIGKGLVSNIQEM